MSFGPMRDLTQRDEAGPRRRARLAARRRRRTSPGCSRTRIGGAIGSAVARAFASEGGDLFLTGRHLAAVEAVAKDVASTGGSVEAAEVDALDEQAVDTHLQSVTDQAGRIDISFNAE
jgi:NAD(P)-dependent dehydrogenase (short-subunit alcohol dehydrogenase family)